MSISRKSWAALLIAAAACLAFMAISQRQRDAKLKTEFAAPYCAHGYENLCRYYIHRLQRDGDISDARKLADLLDKAPDKEPQGPWNDSLRPKAK